MNKKSPLYVPELHDQKETVLPDVSQIEQEIKSNIPSHFIPIYLDSKGRLSAPKLLHFPDYTMEDALNLNSLDEDNQAYALVSTLNKMNFEKFDCSDLHPKELMQILFTLHATFIGSSVEKEYYLNEDLPEGSEEGQKDHPSNIKTVDLKISQLKWSSIDEDQEGKLRKTKFREPFTLETKQQFTDPETKQTRYNTIRVKVRLSRMKDMIFAKKYCDELFHSESLKFLSYKKDLNRIRAISNPQKRESEYNKLIDNDDEGWRNYQKHLTQYQIEQAKVMQASLIVSVGDQVLETFEQKYDAYKNLIPTSIWKKYDEVNSDFNFGLRNEVSFYAEGQNEKLTRRFQFRFTDFLPTDQEADSGGVTVSFD